MGIALELSFKEFLQKEFSNYHLPLSLKNYLVDLLSYYLNSEQLFEKKEGRAKYHEKNLTDLYEKSQNSQSLQEQTYIFKNMGDFSLYISGFFRESIKKKLVDLSYYEDLGQAAYHMVSQAYAPRHNVFKELSQDFKALSKTLFSLQKQFSRRSQSRYLLNLPEQEPCPLTKKQTKLIKQ